jgi:hypothetical protein
MNKKCENCLWYFVEFKLYYDQMATEQPNETCPRWTDDKELNTHTELSRVCEC